MPISPALERLLEQVFDRASDDSLQASHPDQYENSKYDFVFHMLDWEGDLEKLFRLYENPDQYDDKTASQVIIGFLYHVIPHLNAAGRLLLDEIPDAFASVEPHREQGPSSAAKPAI